MKRFNVGESINAILDEFNNIEENNFKNILEWFYKNKQFRSMYEEENIKEFILERILISEEYSDSKYNDMIDKIYRNDYLDNNIDKCLVAYIINDIKLYDEIRLETYSLLECYINNYDIYFVNDYMMKLLENNKNNKVILRGYYNSKRIKEEDILNTVEPYTSVTLGTVIYPFIDKNIAITDISTVSGEVLYKNDFIPANYNLEDKNEIDKLRRRKFGLKRDENI